MSQISKGCALSMIKHGWVTMHDTTKTCAKFVKRVDKFCTMLDNFAFWLCHSLFTQPPGNFTCFYLECKYVIGSYHKSPAVYIHKFLPSCFQGPHTYVNMWRYLFWCSWSVLVPLSLIHKLLLRMYVWVTMNFGVGIWNRD